MQKIVTFFTSVFKRRSVPKVSSTESGKLPFLESVRGLAALAVVWSHLLATFFPGASGGPSTAPVGNEWLARLFYGLPFGFTASGHFAVVIFFTLSGFVLTYKYFQDHDVHDLRKQAAKRYFRLAIPIFFTVLLAYLLLANGAMGSIDKVASITHSPEAARIFNFVPQLGQAFYNATVGVIINNDTSYDPVLWTMPVELFGSFIVFGLAALIGKLQRRWVLYIAAIVALSQTYFTCFIIGMALADLATNTNFIEVARTKINKVYVYALLAVVAVLASFPFPTIDIQHSIFHALVLPGVEPGYNLMFWHFLAAPVLLAIILIRPELQRLLSLRVLVFLGGISFALYLTHYLILHSLGDYVFASLFDRLGLNRAALLASLATVGVTLVVSVLWKKYIDDMSVQLSRRFAYAFLK